jgi:NADH-quinone oxidoreductase subunit L
VAAEHQQEVLAEVGRPLFLQPYIKVGEHGAPVSWISVGSFDVPFALLVDPLSLLMTLVVTGVGSLIHVYSLGYMAHDAERVRYFSYLNLFTFFMLLLVLGGSLPLLFVGWEGVGLCSYLLIGFWYRKQSASRAGMKAFVVNRIGDAGLILGMVLAFHALGTVDLVELAENAAALPREGLGEWGVVTALCLLLFVGACGKSAQVPLHVWLPDAMEGPTPVSALIHAATMVTAGVYMVSRLAAVFSRSETAMLAVAVVGTVTALMAATIAIVQTDIKKVLAYSTVSQLGFMFLACGVGAFAAGIFHLFTHAFFKALLFLGAGSVIHALSGEQDLRQMGGLRTRIPWTFRTFAVGTAAIAGIPFLAGFFSKDLILAGALGAHKTVLFAVAFFTALLTSFYMARLLALAFLGAYRGPLASGPAPAAVPDAHAATVAHDAHDAHDDAHGGHGQGGIHESPWVMLAPLVILAVGSAVTGYLKIPEFVGPALMVEGEHAGHAAWLPWLAGAGAILASAAGIYLYTSYADLRARLAAALRPLARVFESGYWLDQGFHWFARRTVVDGSERVLWKGLDVAVIDGAVNGSAAVVAATARGARAVQSGLVRGYALLMLGGAVAVLAYLLWQ